MSPHPALEPTTAVAALGALAQETRLRVFRLLVERGPEGMPAGAIATEVMVPPSSLTFHLQQLLQAGMVSQCRRGRHLIYAADHAAVNALVAYLTENCCGQGAACAPVCDPRSVSASPQTDAA